MRSTRGLIAKLAVWILVMYVPRGTMWNFSLQTGK